LGIIVDGDVDALADLEGGGVAPRLGERLPHDRHLLGEPFRRGRPGSEEAVAVLDGAPQRIGMAGAEPASGDAASEMVSAPSRRPSTARTARRS